MTDWVLSAERHSELSELLNDEERLNVEHPKVADYLDTALRLPGTGNADKDQAFDLRLVHFMVGGEDVDTVNPYWDIVAPAVSDRDGRRVIDGGAIDGSARLGYAQMVLQAAYAYAVPSPDTVQWVADCCDGHPLLELGAGRGYWAAQLAAAGVKVAAYDSEPPDVESNDSFPQAAGQRDVWHPVGTAGSAEVVDAHPGHVLFLCWPPGWGNPMAAEALGQFEQAGGERVVYVGQPRGGMNGTDAFFDALDAGWHLSATDDAFVSWWNLRDVAQVWGRK